MEVALSIRLLTYTLYMVKFDRRINIFVLFLCCDRRIFLYCRFFISSYNRITLPDINWNKQCIRVVEVLSSSVMTFHKIYVNL